jgi:hypothetical protein
MQPDIQIAITIYPIKKAKILRRPKALIKAKNRLSRIPMQKLSKELIRN